jgi:uncharacterized protein (TIGR03084 family)
MDEILDALGQQHAELDGLVRDLDDAGWNRPSRCDGWTVADVLLHLAQTDEAAIASLGGGLDGLTRSWQNVANVDDAADDMVAAERGRSGPELYDRWRSGTIELRSALGDDDPSRRVPWVAGELSVRTLTATRLSEAWIHTGDVAVAFGPLPPATDRLRHIARLAWRTLPYAFARAGRTMSGPVALELGSPSGELWYFTPDEPPATTVRGAALDLCLVAGQRADAADTALEAEGPDADAVLELIRTFA